MINNIKIYGERNSGTNFLTRLIRKNLRNINICSPLHKNHPDTKDKTGWKHGYPKLNNISKQDTLIIFIIRDLIPWLKSMHANPYHLKKIENYNDFLTKKIKAQGKWFPADHDVHVYPDETNITIFDLRYKKINSYTKAAQQLENVMIVNLEDLQTDKGEKFINTINKKFNILKKEKFIKIEKHTKPKLASREGFADQQNRQYDVNFDLNIINKYKNSEVEEFVNKLKKNFFIKSNQ
tara:strand:+ start:244 stop:954 length:711 start_codon:yes stop_codon:yes gene_type:complete